MSKWTKWDWAELGLIAIAMTGLLGALELAQYWANHQ